MTQQRPTNTAGALLSGVIAHVTTLVRKEILLARAEVGAQVKRAAGALGLLALAAVVMVCGLTVLAGAAVAALMTAGLSPALAATLVGGALVIVAGALILRGRAVLRDVTLVPDRAATTLADDFDILKETLNDR